MTLAIGEWIVEVVLVEVVVVMVGVVVVVVLTEFGKHNDSPIARRQAPPKPGFAA